MKRFPSVKKNSEFQVTYRNGTSYANRLLVMYVMKTGEEENRIGISVSKKVGNSVVRHHITRLLREIFRFVVIKGIAGKYIADMIRRPLLFSGFNRIAEKTVRSGRRICSGQSELRCKV